MNDEEIKAIERCNELIKESHSCWIGITNQVAIQTVLNLIEKKDKIINEMAEYIYDRNAEGAICSELWKKDCEPCIPCIKEYFENKVKESKVTDTNVGD